MKDKEKEIYLNIRAEQIAEFQNKQNGDKFKEPYPLDLAKQKAEMELKGDLQENKLRITLEELLLFDNETCQKIIDDNLNNRFKKIIKKLLSPSQAITQEVAVAWWKSLPTKKQITLRNKHFPRKDMLTQISARNIEIIWKLEMGHEF